MQDLKEMGDRFELRMGNKEVALLVGALFLMLVLSFALGVMMGKRLYGQAPGQQVVTEVPQTPMPSEPPPTTTPVATAPAPVSTSEQYTFQDTLRNEPAPTRPAPSQMPPVTTPMTTPTTPPAATPPAATPPRAPPSEPVAEPEPSPTTSPAGRATTPGAKFFIQIGSGPSQKGADDTVRGLKAKGLDAWSYAGTLNNAPYYRIRIGHYNTREEAVAEMSTLKAAGTIPADSFVPK